MDRTMTRTTTKTEVDASEVGWGCALIILLLFLSPFFALLDAWAVRVFWAWYITPGWGWPVPSYLAVVGASMLIRYFRPSSPAPEGEDWKKAVGRAFSSNIFTPLMFLLFAWIFKVVLFR